MQSFWVFLVVAKDAFDPQPGLTCLCGGFPSRLVCIMQNWLTVSWLLFFLVPGVISICTNPGQRCKAIQALVQLFFTHLV